MAPTTLFRAAADLVVVVHAAFVLFVVLGGLLVVRWPRLAWVHVPDKHSHPKTVYSASRVAVT
jgi:hypothetical protein